MLLKRLSFYLLTPLVLLMPTTCISGSLSSGDWIIEVNETNGNLTNWENSDSVLLFEHGFWYRDDNSGKENRFNSNSEFTLTNSNFDTSNASLEFSGDRFEVKIDYELSSGPSESESSIQQEITISNTDSEELNLHWFEYMDLDASVFGVDQAFGDLSSIFQYEDPSFLAGDEPIFLRNDVSGSLPSFFEIDAVDNFDSLLDKLEDSQPTTLAFTSFNDDFAQDFVDDLAFVLQWDLSIDPSESVSIASTKRYTFDTTTGTTPDTVVPEPHTVVLLLSGLGILVYCKDKRIVC